MLPKRFKLRLRSETDFFNQAERFFSKFFTIFHRENDRQLEVVVVVPKKAARLATARNNLKRQVYSILTPLLKKYQEVPCSVVIVAKPAIQTLTAGELKAELAQAFKKIL